MGDQVSLFVNSKKIASAKDRTYAGGWYGLWVATDPSAHTPAEVRFTNFVVRAA